MPGDNEKVIGYFGYVSPTNAVCDGDACVISGSEETLRKYLKVANWTDIDKIIIKKTRFGEVLRGLLLGGPYSFDEEAYQRFYPLAKKAGLDIPIADFRGENNEIKFVTIRLKDSGR